MYHFIHTEFSYVVDDQRHYVTPPPGNAHNEQFLMVAGDTEGKIHHVPYICPSPALFLKCILISYILTN